MDPAFAGAGTSPGMELWRIENKAPVKIPEVDGKFHTGDSYILLVTKQGRGAIEWNIHFWLGSETSQDESGIAAYKTVELDEGLGGGPVQYREVQGNESALFMSYFKDGGIEYLPGGVASGFVHVERDSYRTRLLQVKGRRTVRVTEVECAASSLNTGDVFILDLGLQLYQYNGESANRYEKAKAMETITKIKNQERGGRANITIINEDPNNAEFWGALGGQIQVTNPGADDAAAERAAMDSLKAFKISDASGAVEFSEVATAPLDKAILDTNDVFLIDSGNELYLWVGRGANPTERREGMVYAAQYLANNGRPANTQVQRVAESAETPMFKGLFKQWDPPVSFSFGMPQSSNIAATPEQQEIDIAALQARKAAADVPVDDGSGTLQVWRIENMEKVEVDPETYGQFFGGDSYVMLYTYTKGSAEEYIIYFWQGRESSNDEKGASALLAKALDDELGDRPVQVRVPQGKEPAHFRQLFKGRMIVHSGGKASGFKNRNDGDSMDTDGVGLFHVKGTTPLNTYAIQVPEVAASLNSGDCFVLVTPETVYVWHGVNANADELEVANNVAGILCNAYQGTGGRSIVDVPEHSEPAEFWAAIGGEGGYATARPGEPAPQDPRLFQCTNMTGAFTVDEVVDFTQEDLIDDDVMLLDVGTALYVWVGSQSNDQEKRMAMETAQRFVSEATDGRDPETPITMVKAGAEPGMFSQFFPGWDPDMANRNKFVDPYEAKLAAMRAAQEEAKGEEEAPAPAPAAPVYVAPSASGTYSLEVLQMHDDLPAEVNPEHKEDYLSDADFEAVFGMTKAAFSALPKWKKAAKKREKNLF